MTTFHRSSRQSPLRGGSVGRGPSGPCCPLRPLGSTGSRQPGAPQPITWEDLLGQR